MFAHLNRRVLLPAYVALVPCMWATWALHAQWADAVFVIAALAFVASEDRAAISIDLLDAAVGLYLIALAASLIGAASPRAGATELLKTVALAAVYGVLSTVLRGDEDRRRLARWFAIVAMAFAAAGVAVFAGQLLGVVPDGWLGAVLHIPYLGAVRRLTMGIFTPELFGDFLTVTAPFVLAVLLEPSEGRAPRLRIVALVAAVALAELLTFSHSWVGFLAACLIACWNRWHSAAWHWTRASLVAACVALLIATNLASTVYLQHVDLNLEHVPEPAGDIPVHVNRRGDWTQARLTVTMKDMHYFALKAIAWDAFRDHPMTGIGLGNFVQATEREYQEGRLESVCRACLPHSTFMGHLAETGVVGTAALALLFASAFVVARRTVNAGSTAAARWIARSSAAGLAGLLVNGINADIMHFRFLWIALALLRASSR